jgi:phosphate binding protein
MLVVVAAVVLAACGLGMPPPGPALSHPDSVAGYMPDAVSGDIVIAGSSTVFPLSERTKQRFEEEGFVGHITIDSIGSGGGLERFCVAGEIDISNASRAIKDSEIESCRGIGRDPIQFHVGIDAIAVAVSTENDFADDVTLEELARVFSTAAKWSDVRPDWPAEDILRFTPGTDSGTFDFFIEAVLARANEENFQLGEEAALNAANLQLSEDDNVLIQGVAGSRYAVGYFGYAYYDENRATLKPLSIDGVAPSAESAESGEYALARPLLIYSDKTIMQAKPQVAAFIYFSLTGMRDEILDVGYFPTSRSKTGEDLNAWKASLGL